MKKRIIISASISIALCASIFSSCTKQEEPLAPASEKNGNFSVTFIEEPLETKTEFYNKTIRWREGDKVAFSQFATVDKQSTYKGTYVTVSSSREILSATLSSFNTPDEGTNSFYFSVFPSGNFTSYDKTSFESYQSGTDSPLIRITTPNTQTPVVNEGVPVSFDPNADLLISNIKDNLTPETEGTNAGKYVMKVTYYRKVAIGKMTIKNLPSEAPVTSIEFSAAKENGSAVTIAGKRWYNVETGDVYSTTTADKTLTLDYSDNPVNLVYDAVDNCTKMEAHFCCYPFSLGENDAFCVVVKTEDGEVFTKYVSLGAGKDLILEAGKGTQFSVDMSSAVKSANWLSVSEYNSGTSVKTATKLFFLAKETTDLTISSGKYAAIPESTFLDPSFDIATYFETNGSAMAASSINSFNDGKSLIFSSVSLEPDSWYIVAIKLVAVDTDSNEVVGYAFTKIKTDWFSMTVSTSSKGGINYIFYGKGIASMRAARTIETAAQPETDYETYYTNTLSPGTYKAEVITNIHNAGHTGYGYRTSKYNKDKSNQADMTVGTSYTTMVKATNGRGETKFCYASANAGGTAE